MSFIVFESIDGAGKGTISKVFSSIIRGEKPVFDIDEYSKEKGFLPQFLDENKSFYIDPSKYDFYKTSEPTSVGIGKNIREHVLKFDFLNYSPLDIALQFSLDRRALYERVIIPLKERKKFIIQERSVVSSLVYQVEHSKFFGGKKLSLKEVSLLEGNKIALEKENMFDILFILYLPLEEAMKRLKERTKSDDVFYEQKIAFQKSLLEKYQSKELKKFLLQKNPNLIIIYLDVSKSLEETIKILREVYEKHLKRKLGHTKSLKDFF